MGRIREPLKDERVYPIFFEIIIDWSITMIARLHVLIPFTLTIPDGERFAIHGFIADGYKVMIYPPKKSADQKQGDAPDNISINGVQGFQADVLRIDFHKDTFERSKDGKLDPPELLIKEVIDWFLLKLRFVTRASRIRPVDFPHVTWRLDYLNDDESELKEEEGLVRARFGRRVSMTWSAVNKDVWDAVFNLPGDYQPPKWYGLLLDAEASLPEVGTAIVLTVTALEVFISHVLDALAKRNDIPADIWIWINEREWLKQPSLEEQFDSLLKILSGKSLKDADGKLWEAFKNLKNARNTFVHGGVAKIGNDIVSVDDAVKILRQARDIIDFVKKNLPAELHWPEFRFQMKIEASKKIFNG